MHKQAIIKFGRWESTSILMNALIVKIILGFPQQLSGRAGSALWLSSLLSGLLMSAIIWLMVKLYDKFEGMDLYDIAQRVGGRPLRAITATLVLLALLGQSAVALRLAVEGLSAATPYAIPPLLATLLIAVVMGITAYRGIEGLARVHAIFVPAILFALAFILIFTSGNYRITNLFPFWGLGAANTVWQGVRHVTSYSDVLVLFLLYPYMNNKQQFRRTALWGVNLSTLFIVLANLSYILSLQYPECSEFVMPIFQLSRIITFGDYAQSLEAIFLPLWMLSSTLYLCLSFVLLVRAIGDGYGIQHYKFATLPAIFCILVLNYLPHSMMTAMNIGAQLNAYMSIPGLALPVVLLIIARLFTNRKEGRL